MNSIVNRSTISNDKYIALKREVLSHTQQDYLFFVFLLGYVRRYLNEQGTSDSIRNCVYCLIYDLLKETDVVVLFVTESSLEAAHWKDEDDIHRIITRVAQEWDQSYALGEDPDYNIWLTYRNNVEVKNKEGLTKMLFGPYFRRIEDDVIFVDIFVTLYLGSGEIKKRITLRISELQQLAVDLKRQADDSRYSFVFQSEEQTLRMELKSAPNETFLIIGWLHAEGDSSPYHFLMECTLDNQRMIMAGCNNMYDVMA